MASRIAEEAGWPRERLDRDYNARATIPVAAYEAEMLRYRAMSDAARESHATHLDVVYDEESGQTLDIFGTAAGELRPVFVFIHGGYWRALSKRDSAFMAGMLAKHGVASVAVDYRLAPETSLTEIVREMRAAIAFLSRNGRTYGIDPDGIFVGNDMMALGALFALKEGGLSVPDDIALVGFDDVPIARFAQPALSTLRVGVYELGRRGLELLADALANPDAEPAEGIVISPELVIRESSRRTG